MATCDTATLFANSSCFTCLTPGQWQILELQLLCEIVAAGGAGGGSGILCGVGSPAGVIVPTSTCALYVDTSNGTLYTFYSGSWH